MVNSLDKVLPVVMMVDVEIVVVLLVVVGVLLDCGHSMQSFQLLGSVIWHIPPLQSSSDWQFTTSLHGISGLGVVTSHRQKFVIDLFKSSIHVPPLQSASDSQSS